MSNKSYELSQYFAQMTTSQWAADISAFGWFSRVSKVASPHRYDPLKSADLHVRLSIAPFISSLVPSALTDLGLPSEEVKNLKVKNYLEGIEQELCVLLNLEWEATRLVWQSSIDWSLGTISKATESVLESKLPEGQMFHTDLQYVSIWTDWYNT